MKPYTWKKIYKNKRFVTRSMLAVTETGDKKSSEFKWSISSNGIIEQGLELDYRSGEIKTNIVFSFSNYSTSNKLYKTEIYVESKWQDYHKGYELLYDENEILSKVFRYATPMGTLLENYNTFGHKTNTIFLRYNQIASSRDLHYDSEGRLISLDYFEYREGKLVPQSENVNPSKIVFYYAEED